METAIVSAETQEKLNRYKETAFEFTKTKKSGFVKDETGIGNIPAVHLSHSKTHFLLMRSRLFLGAGNGYMPTQYVVNMPTHYVNDYYEDAEGNLVLESLFINAEKAREKNYQYRPGLLTLFKNDTEALRKDLVNSNKLGICFEDGRLELGKYSTDPILIKFINEHEQNDFAPRSKDNKDPKRSYLFQFQPTMREQKSAKSRPVANFDEDFNAMEFVSKLRKKSSEGYEYDQDMLNAVLYILEDGRDLGVGMPNQKFELIVNAVKKDGAAFMTMVNDAFNEYKMDIAQAEKLKVINFTGKEVKMSEDGKESTIYTYKKGTNKSVNMEELIVFFLTPKGDSVHTEMTRLMDIAKISALGK